MAETVESKLNALVARVSKVRRWLVTLAILKVAALCLLFVSVYIGVYAWLDHRFNFDEIGRIIALILLLAGLGFLLHRLTRLLLVHISCSGAANYIENRRSFDQQLVTTIEYYENKQDYPYSRALAEQLVLHVDKDSREFKFDTTVDKWQGWALGAVILFGLVAAWFYVRDNYVYFSSYFARLASPLASVEPLSATSLESVTKDIIAEPDSEVRFAAQIKGRVPEFGKLVLVDLEPKSADDSEEKKPVETQILPGFDAEKSPRFEAARSFPQTGRFKYRFEAGPASTDWHEVSICQAPAIESMTANVTLPKRPPRREWVEPYTEQIKSGALQVVPQSRITLNVQATDKLKEVVLTGLDGQKITRELNGAKEFTYNFTADRSGSIKFDLVNEQGLVNDNVPDLEVIVKADEPPRFELVSPEGDYLATDVASVPVTFSVSDDFGLRSVQMCMEVTGQQPTQLEIPVEEGAKVKEFTHTIELESYELTVGDSILFYARATDVDTGSALAERASGSEMYFIEIRPYRQNWRSDSGGGQGQTGGPTPVDLLNILEHTRAILKKTWAIASKPNLTAQDNSTLESIDNDVHYCAEQLVLIRDDSEYGFTDRQKSVLNEVFGYYGQASGHLAEHNSTSAILPEKNAYRVLRKFIIELEKELNPPQSGQSQQEEKPDSVEIEQMPEFSQYEKERIESELKELEQKLEKLTQEQKDLNKTFENFLKEQAQQKGSERKVTDGKPSGGSAEEQAEDGRAGEQQSKAPSDQKGKSASEAQGDSQGQSDSQGQNDSQGQGDSQGQSASKGQGSSQDRGTKRGQSGSENRSPGETESAARGRGNDRAGSANAEARLRMLQAKQGALQQEVSQLKRDLQKLPDITEDDGNRARAEVEKHLDEAIANMDDSQTELAEARYQADLDEANANVAVELMESAERELDLAKEALEGELTLSDEQRLADKAQEMAEQLAEGADALDESVTAVEREEMLARLEAAKRLLKMMPEPQWSTVQQGQGSTLGASAVYTRNPNLAPAEAAREMARQFWSIAINAKKRQRQLLEDESSDVKFYGQEKEFFENAAKFEQETVRK